MSKCIVKLCKNTTRKDLASKGLQMHEFPSDLQRLKQWLLLIGQNFGSLDTFAHRIIRAKDPSPPSKKPRLDPLRQGFQTLLEAYNRERAKSKQKDASTTTGITYKDVSTRTDLYFHTREIGVRTIPYYRMRSKKVSTDPKWGKKKICLPPPVTRGLTRHQSVVSKWWTHLRVPTRNLEILLWQSLGKSDMITCIPPKTSAPERTPHMTPVTTRQVKRLTSRPKMSCVRTVW
ncbi:uncharacterized protein [Engystomops pustulosus]|uniref:uncharacterized protein n=1 Tax=Engystomops pustulosus TaxID=76066 RepID=UPI003AFADA77